MITQDPIIAEDKYMEQGVGTEAGLEDLFLISNDNEWELHKISHSLVPLIIRAMEGGGGGGEGRRFTRKIIAVCNSHYLGTLSGNLVYLMCKR